ncbi:MAG: caspase family protein [Gemmataceae bacterium]
MTRRTTLNLLALLLTLAVPFTPAANAAELKRLHILMVFDSQTPELARGLKIDELRMRKLWQETIPNGRYQLTVLSGRAVKRANILGHFKALQVAADEGVVCYYAGHGATEPTSRRHYFNLSSDRPLFRSEVVAAMRGTGAPLTVLMTDCCSTLERLRNKVIIQQRGLGSAGRLTAATTPARTLHPTVRALLFEARGTVDVTAATGNASWSDVLKGGLFTRSIARTFRSPVRDADGRLTWKEYFPKLQHDTELLFKEWKKEMIARGETSITERNQKPHAFSLGDDLAERAARLATVGIENATGKPLTYRYRWNAAGTWSELRLQAGEKKLHSSTVGVGASLPSLERGSRGWEPARASWPPPSGPGAASRPSPPASSTAHPAARFRDRPAPAARLHCRCWPACVFPPSPLESVLVLRYTALQSLKATLPA